MIDDTNDHVGAGTGSATKAILEQIHRYATYTYTDISAGFFDEAHQKFKNHDAAFIYRVLDIGKDVAEQNFVESSYDLVIASNVLHATLSLDRSLQNARRLLKPGGYLLLMENTNIGPLRIPFLFCGLPGWMLAEEDERSLSPLFSSKRWDAALCRNGFSGVDTITPDSQTILAPFSVIVSQAVDSQITSLRQPLSLVGADPVIDHLLVLGGGSLLTSRLIETIKVIQVILNPFCNKLTLVEDLTTLSASTCSLRQIILSLAELDSSLFASMTELKWGALKTLFELSKNVLWVVQGGREGQPYANTIAAVSRCIKFELAHLRLQILDIDNHQKPDAHQIVETLLRLQITQKWDTQGARYDLLWTRERELAMTKDGVQIPRFVPSTLANDRYNSAIRTIRTNVTATDQIVEISPSDDSFDLQTYKAPLHSLPAEEMHLTIQVSRSVLTAVHIKATGYLYLIIGSTKEIKRKVLAFSKSQLSAVSVPETWTIPCPISEEQESSVLLDLAYQLIAVAVIAKTPSKTSLLIHEPSLPLASALASQAAEKRVSTVITTTKPDISEPSWIRFHPNESDRVIQKNIPVQCSMFKDFSAETDSISIGSRIGKLVPTSCKRKAVSAFTRPMSHLRPDFLSETATNSSLEICRRRLIELCGKPSLKPVETVSLEEVLNQPVRSGNLQIVDWSKSTSIPVRVFPAESEVSLQSTKTYLLVGATGDVGQSPCRWMIPRGARYIVLTSRTPNVKQSWLDEMQSLGATVKIYPMLVIRKPHLISANLLLQGCHRETVYCLGSRYHP